MCSLGRWQNLITRHELSAVYRGSPTDSTVTPSSTPRLEARFRVQILRHVGCSRVLREAIARSSHAKMRLD
jgi:hypothetical protein